MFIHPARQVFAYTVVTLFILFFLSDGIWTRSGNAPLLIGGTRAPDFSVYRTLRTLSAVEFPLDDVKRRVIVVGDIHGMHKSLVALLKKVSYNPTRDVLIHVGDILTKNSHNESMTTLAYMASNEIIGVRGNHDQRVIEWRGWINWIISLPGGEQWLEEISTRWLEAEAGGATPEVWLKNEKKSPKKWWRKIPQGWTLFSDHFKIARAMSEAQYNYLLSLPLKIHIPSAHAYIVHAGLLSSDPNYAPNHRRQPLAHIPKLPPKDKGRTLPKNETYPVLRRLQEQAILNDVPQNKVPWNVLNMRSIFKGKISKEMQGKAWATHWKDDMFRCQGFDQILLTTKPKEELLPCYPSTIIYGHAASRGLDINRWSIGLDSGCVYQRRLTALVLGARRSTRQGSNDTDTTQAKTSIAFGDNGHGEIISVSCS